MIEHPDSVEDMVEALEERMSSLNIDQNKARVYLTTLISEQNTVYMVIYVYRYAFMYM